MPKQQPPDMQPKKIGLERVRSATVRAKAFLEDAKRLEARLGEITAKRNITYPAGKNIAQFVGPELGADETETKETNEAIGELESLLRAFDGVMTRTGLDTDAARGQVTNDDPAADELDQLRAEIRKLRDESSKWRMDETASLGVGPESVTRPEEFGRDRVDVAGRLVEALLRLVGEDVSASDIGVDRLLEGIRRPSEPSPIPTDTREPSAPPTEVRPEVRPEPRPEPRAEPRGTDVRVDPEAEPWPSSRAEFRRQFTYSVDKFGSRENYGRYLAERLNTQERMNQFLENMFTYTRDRDMGQRQRLLNYGPTGSERDEKWVPALEFLTSYNADGMMYGDCDDIAIAFQYIASLQGKQAFAIETSTSERGPTGALTGNGHALAAWFEADGSLRIVDTTRSGGAQAVVQRAERRPGETDEAFLKRAYQEFRIGSNPFEPSALLTVTSMPNGDGYNLPANLAFARRQTEFQPMLRDGRFRDVIRIVDEEIGRDRTNLNLRLSKIQLLLLADAPRAEVTSAVEALSGPPPVDRPNQFNIYGVSVTRNALLQKTPQYVAECNALTKHCNGPTA